KLLSLFFLLDEESNLIEAADLTFSHKLKNLLDANNCFKEERGGAFSVRHYAEEVIF
ncbi:myosin-J heavy chain-like protein, partial [Trifolium pratense]